MGSELTSQRRHTFMLKSPASDSTSAPINRAETKAKIEASEKAFSLNAKDKYYALLFLGPSLLILGIFIFYPMFKTLYLSLFLTNTVGKPTVFVGLSNYINLLTSADYLNSLAVTMVYVLAVTALTIALGLLLASLASKKIAGIGFFRTLFSSTMGVSVSVAAIFWLFIFNPSTGFLSLISTWLHLPAIGWLTDPTWAMVAVIITTVWMNLGFTFLILFGAIQSVPTTLYEAASIEGASSRFQFFHITIPSISPTCSSFQLWRWSTALRASASLIWWLRVGQLTQPTCWFTEFIRMPFTVATSPRRVLKRWFWRLSLRYLRYCNLKS